MLNKQLTLIDVIKQLLKQPCDILNKLNGNKNELVWFHLIIFSIWSTSIAILAFSFSSSLLMIYFKSLPVNVVDSLEDVLLKSHLNIAGNASGYTLISPVSSYIDTIKPIQVDFFKRITKYESKMKITHLTDNILNHFVNEFIIKDVLDGKTVLLMPSSMTDLLLNNYAKYNLKLVNNNKDRKLYGFRVSRNNKYSHKITKL